VAVSAMRCRTVGGPVKPPPQKKKKKHLRHPEGFLATQKLSAPHSPQAQSNDVARVEVRLAAGTDVDAPSKLDGRTALWLAAEAGAFRRGRIESRCAVLFCPCGASPCKRKRVGRDDSSALVQAPSRLSRCY
jgi:hypothetical protein